MIQAVKIQGFKSIKNLSLQLRNLTVLIGSNGVGKSNFISFFELTKAIFQQNLGRYIMDNGGINTLLYKGRKVTEQVLGLLDFDNVNAFEFILRPGQSGKGYINRTSDYFNKNSDNTKNYSLWHHKVWDTNVEESALSTNTLWRAGYLKKYLQDFTVYHFHDTSSSSPMREPWDINDNVRMRDNGSNLAAFLFKLQQSDRKAYDLIEGTIKSVAPYFKRFVLAPDRNLSGKISLEWEEIGSDMRLNGHSFSDGTIRFIALATLLLQTDTPSVIIIDEPELGLHPTAINKFASLVKRASRKSQIILSTQSTNLVNCFEPNNILVVDRKEDQTVFRYLSADSLSIWLKDYNYCISDLWEKNLIGGQL